MRKICKGTWCAWCFKFPIISLIKRNIIILQQNRTLSWMWMSFFSLAARMERSLQIWERWWWRKKHKINRNTQDFHYVVSFEKTFTLYEHETFMIWHDKHNLSQDIWLQKVLYQHLAAKKHFFYKWMDLIMDLPFLLFFFTEYRLLLKQSWWKLKENHPNNHLCNLFV